VVCFQRGFRTPFPRQSAGRRLAVGVNVEGLLIGVCRVDAAIGRVTVDRRVTYRDPLKAQMLAKKTEA
jgi:hypothetical protein